MFMMLNHETVGTVHTHTHTHTHTCNIISNILNLDRKRLGISEI